MRARAVPHPAGTDTLFDDLTNPDMRDFRGPAHARSPSKRRVGSVLAFYAGLAVTRVPQTMRVDQQRRPAHEMTGRSALSRSGVLLVAAIGCSLGSIWTAPRSLQRPPRMLLPLRSIVASPIRQRDRRATRPIARRQRNRLMIDG